MNPIQKTKYRNPLEVLVLPKNALGLDETKPVACCHILQAIQLQELQEQELFPACDIEVVSEDLTAALARLDERGSDGESRYSGLICNGFDLERLGEAERVRAVFLPEEMIPKAGRDCKNEVEARAEIAFLEEMQRLCPRGQEPLTAVYAEGDEKEVELWALLYDSTTQEWWTDWIAGRADEAELLGREFAVQIGNAGLQVDEE